MIIVLVASVVANIIMIYVLLTKNFNFTIQIPDNQRELRELNDHLEGMLELAKKRDRDGIRLWGYTFESFKQCDANFKELTKRIETLEK